MDQTDILAMQIRNTCLKGQEQRATISHLEKVIPIEQSRIKILLCLLILAGCGQNKETNQSDSPGSDCDISGCEDTPEPPEVRRYQNVIGGHRGTASEAAGTVTGRSLV